MFSKCGARPSSAAAATYQPAIMAISNGVAIRGLAAPEDGRAPRPRAARVKRVLDNPARRSKFKIMKTCVPPGGATGRWAGTGERRLCRERFGSHYQTIGNNDGRKRNQNPFDDKMTYPPFPLPNTCLAGLHHTQI